MDVVLPKFEDHERREWFVFVRRFHHGPFTESEVIDRIAAGRIDSESFIWTRELGDWAPITEVDLFKDVVAICPPFIGEEEKAARDVALDEIDMLRSLQMLSAPAYKTDSEIDNWTEGALFETPSREAANSNALISAESKDSRNIRLAVTAISLAVVIVAGVAFCFHQNHFPVLSDVSKNEATMLEAAADASLSNGARVAIVVSNTDLIAPKIYIGTNEPEGSKLTVHLEGIETTLVGRARAAFSYDVIVDRQGLASTPIVRFTDGQPLPRGDFRITVACASCTTPINGEKILFLGGERNKDYEGALTAYNEKLRAQAAGEIGELGQLTDTVLNQLKETTSHGRNGWPAFDHHWTQLQTQIEAMFFQWTPAFFDNEVFYGPLYRDLKAAGTSVSELHAEQNKFAFGGAKDAALAQQIESDARDVRRRVSELQAKIAQAARLAPTANGRPRIDGL